MPSALRTAARGPAWYLLAYAGAHALSASARIDALAVYTLAFAAVAAITIHAALDTGCMLQGRRGLPALLLALVAVVAVAQVLAPADALSIAVHGALLLGFACSVGAVLGREVVDPAHLWPLVVVAASADLFSVLAPAGVTRAILDGTAPVSLSAVVLHLPITTDAPPAPLLGVGDLLFTGFLGGAAARLDLPPRRSVVGLAAGFATCLGGLLAVEVPLPALPFLGVGFAFAHGARIRPRARELALALGVAGLLGVLGATALGGR